VKNTDLQTVQPKGGSKMSFQVKTDRVRKCTSLLFSSFIFGSYSIRH